MKFLQHLKTIIKHPSILKPYKRIILLSHMRANTSLFGHVLGSNPEIEGYYELHMGYFSWKSLIRQKLKYFSEHRPKKNSKYIFDKVLHNEHYVDTGVFSDNDIFIIMIREPIATIQSIQKLFAKVDPKHEYNDEKHARSYYVTRLEKLVNMANTLNGRYLFINADNLTQSPDSILSGLTEQLALTKPLSKRYKKLKNTGLKGAGDSSENMFKGEIQAKEIKLINYATTDPELGEIYHDAVQKFIKNSHAVIN